MAFILEDAFQSTKEQYQLTLLAGKSGLSSPVSWVYQLEETTIISHFWGNELAVTMGLGFQTKEKLIELIDILIAHDAAGLFVNIGPYMEKIDQEVITYCEERNFPLVTVPWEIILADLIKDYCIRVFRTDNVERELAEAFILAIESPGLQDSYRPMLNRNYNVEGVFQVALFMSEKTDSLPSLQKRRLLFSMRRVLDAEEILYSVFWYQDCYVLITNDVEEKRMVELLNRINQMAHSHQPDIHLHIGFGTKVISIEQLHYGYSRAMAALHMAKLRNVPVFDFKDMGVYQILFSVRDKEILVDFYEKTLMPLITYDKEHNSNYVDTLYYFLKYNGSIQAIAEATYTHRNTVLYRIKKVKELLNSELEDTEERFPYQIAFYIREMRKDGKDEITK